MIDSLGYRQHSNEETPRPLFFIWSRGNLDELTRFQNTSLEYYRNIYYNPQCIDMLNSNNCINIHRYFVVQIV